MYDSLYRCWGKHTVCTGVGEMAGCMTVCTGVGGNIQYVQVRGEMAVCMTVCTGEGGNGCMYDSIYR